VAVNEKEILALEDKRFGAMIGREFKALEAMVHDDLLYTHSSGVTDTKASWLESMQSGKTTYKRVNCTERKVRVIGEVALVTGRAAIEAEIGGQPRSLKLLFLNAWAKTPRAGSSSPGSQPRSRLERGLRHGQRPDFRSWTRSCRWNRKRTRTGSRTSARIIASRWRPDAFAGPPGETDNEVCPAKGQLLIHRPIRTCRVNGLALAFEAGSRRAISEGCPGLRSDRDRQRSTKGW
jgi:ketosteroid isomerase-like protein